MTEVKLDTVEDVLRSAREVLTAEGRDLCSLLYREMVINALKCKRDENRFHPVSS